MGVDVVGGIPHFERTMADGAPSVKLLCEMAAERGLRSTCTATRATTRCRATSRRWPSRPAPGLQGRVTGSHLTSMHSMDNYYVSKLLPLIAEAACTRSPIR
jgi:cytosine deaminase